MVDTKMKVARMEESESREGDCLNDKKGEVLKPDDDIMQKMDVLSKLEDEYTELISEVASDILEMEQENVEFMKMMKGKLHQCKVKTAIIQKMREELQVAMKEP